MPSILGALQKSVLGVMLGKTVAPDWITHGIPKSALLSSHHILNQSKILAILLHLCLVSVIKFFKFFVFSPLIRFVRW